MKVKIGTISILESQLSINATCPIQGGSLLKPNSPCSLHVGATDIKGKILSKSEKSQHINILIKIPKRKDHMAILWDYQYTDREVQLYTENSVDPDLLNSTQNAIHRLSAITKKEEAEILKEFTTFGNHPGKTDIKQVSPKQMAIVLDKARKEIDRATASA